MLLLFIVGKHVVWGFEVVQEIIHDVLFGKTKHFLTP